ncbi:MAG TPA: phosphoglycolate phosphatase [Spongiibacteraceae bacterium]|nr:phosphoglycolate phosphatase [Spongiibacteraceae bacterium]
MSFEKLLGASLRGPVEALLFDLDGTLLASAPDLAIAIDRMLLELGCAEAGIERVSKWVGDGARQLVVEALRYAQSSIEDEFVDKALQIYQRHYAECLSHRSDLFPGVREALRYWFAQGVRMACVTNKGARFTEPLIDHFGLREWLPVVVSGDTLPQRKPDPAPLLEACRRLQVAPDRAIMVGDSRNDVRAARAANMPVICVRHGYNHGRPIEDETPDRIVDSFFDLTPG